MSINNSDSNPQGGNESNKKIDSIISENEMVHYSNVQLEDICSVNDKTDCLVPTIGINRVTELTGEIIQIPISDILISDIHLKLYESDQKRDKIEELKSSINDVGQLQPIVIAVFMGQNYLLDGRLRLIAMKELKFETVAVIISPSVNDGDTLDNLVLQYHIRKDLNTQEKLNEIIEILQIGKSKPNKYIGIDKRREMVSKKLGRGYSRSKVIELTEILEHEMRSGFGHIFSTSILEGKMKVSDGLTIIQAVKELDYSEENEKESCILKSFSERKINVEKATDLIATFKKKKTPPIDYPKHTASYEIRQGNIFDVDLTDQTFDAVFSSPPYALQRNYGESSNEIGIENDIDAYIKNLVDVFEKAYKQLNDKGSIFVNLNDTWKDRFSLNIIEKFVVEMEKRGIRKVQMVQWEKPNPKPMGSNIHRFVNKFEAIIHFAKSPDYVWNKIGKKRKTLKIQAGCTEVGGKKNGYSIPEFITASYNLLSENMIEGIGGLEEYTTSIKNNPMTLRRKHVEGEEKHTATFNALLPLIPLLSTLPTDRQAVVLDPFSGTSTTGETALALGHKFVGVELYEKNCKTSARILHEAEDKFKGINLMYELVESEAELKQVA